MSNAKRKLVKVQIDSTGTQALVYDRTRNLHWMGPVPADMKDLGPMFKRYAEAAVEEGKVMIKAWKREGFDPGW